MFVFIIFFSLIALLIFKFYALAKIIFIFKINFFCSSSITCVAISVIILAFKNCDF